MPKRSVQIVIAALFLMIAATFVWLRTLRRDYDPTAKRLVLAEAGREPDGVRGELATELAREIGLGYMRLYDKHNLGTRVAALIVAVNGCFLLCCSVVVGARANAETGSNTEQSRPVEREDAAADA